MNEHIIPLSDYNRCVPSLCGAKSAALATISHRDIPVPWGFCIGAEIYRHFLSTTNLGEKILMELGRKEYKEMRWEEMWDAALRIRNLFLRTKMPTAIEDSIVTGLRTFCPNKAVVIRSSSLAEDSADSSFAGIHESFINIEEEDDILKHIKLVWASLWSDAALAYRKELNLNIKDSAMSVIIQEMIWGEKSGVAFGMNPQNTQQSVIECVYGLNKGLVDGDIEPDQWILDRQNGSIVNNRLVEHAHYVVPSRSGVSVASRKKKDFSTPPLNTEEVKQVFDIVKQLEKIFGSPQDMEWTYCQGKLYVLQSRPITTEKNNFNNDRRSFDLSLRRSFENLKALGARIEYDLIPKMLSQADKLQEKKLGTCSNEELIQELENRKRIFDHWKNVYWDHFIPFAHGVRLFGEIYNNRVMPEDPYEFLDLLTGSDMKSIERNDLLGRFASTSETLEGKSLPQEFGSYLGNARVMLSQNHTTGEINNLLTSFLGRLSHAVTEKSTTLEKDTELLQAKFIQSFSETEQPFAKDLLNLAKKSYQLRDDDNIYLGRIEEQLNRALLESSSRLGSKCESNDACNNYEELIRAIKDPDYEPHRAPVEKESTTGGDINARQLRGQPASKGIGRGKARVIKKIADLFSIQKGEILVCDAIDPTMTFVVPLVAAIVERRGGMLIHGAIIAREYGLPCVTGIPQATEFIKTGDDITVDGYFGLVINHTKGALL
jgi:pyruvate,water dikinase